MQKYCILLCFERVSAKAMILDGLLGFPFEVEILEKPMVFSGLSVAGSSFLMKASSSQVPLPTSNFLGGRTRRPDQVVEPGGRTRERGSPACTLMVTSQHHSLWKVKSCWGDCAPPDPPLPLTLSWSHLKTIRFRK